MRLIVYSRTRLFSECLSRALAQQRDVDCAFGISEFSEAAALLETTSISAIIVDLSNPQGWDEARELRRLDDGPRLLGLATGDGPEDLVECARIGCDGVIPHQASLEKTVAITRRAIRGEFVCSPAAAAGLMRAVSEVPAPPALPDCLTLREREICAQVCEGMTNKEIAQNANCSEGTVKNHVHNILTKLGVPRRSGLSHRIRMAEREDAAADR